MNIALDTNRYVDFCRGLSEAVEILQQSEKIFLPFVVLGELRAGFLCGQKSRENERGLVRFLSSPRVRTLFPDEQTTHHYARLFFQIKRQGTPIPTNDLWIAALVMQHDLLLYARDRHFKVLTQLAKV